jgi:ribosomal protein S3
LGGTEFNIAGAVTIESLFKQLIAKPVAQTLQSRIIHRKNLLNDLMDAARKKMTGIRYTETS